MTPIAAMPARQSRFDRAAAAFDHLEAAHTLLATLGGDPELLATVSAAADHAYTEMQIAYQIKLAEAIFGVRS